MKKYVLSTLVCGVACSAGFADAAPRKTLSDYSTPPSNIIKDAELMINAEYTAIDYDKGDAVPDHLYGFRVDWRRNFAIEQKSFWNAGISLGYAQGSEHNVDVSHLTLNLGIDYNIAVGQRTYFFVGTRIGMNQIETKFKDEESTTTNRAQMGLGLGIKHYFPNSNNCLIFGLQRMMVNCQINAVSTTTAYVGYSFAF
ncbi:hypothetical protein [Akkermansia sp.]|uniref:hypothetical protein n=1 Tax=Akkermansia sp. TaxID=1872421 RepID=UPI002671EC18|nr:hypothetical protein [Akkermansia sp.]MEE0763649.1 hypothetical protein [Akkermansia sp.]